MWDIVQSVQGVREPLFRNWVGRASLSFRAVGS